MYIYIYIYTIHSGVIFVQEESESTGALPARIGGEPLKKKRAFDNFKDLLQREVANTPLGMVWMPAPEIALGREAGWLCRNVLRRPRYQAGPVRKEPIALVESCQIKIAPVRDTKQCEESRGIM